MATHEVFNQPPPLEDYDTFATDPVLAPALEREGAGWAVPEAAEFGKTVGSAEVFEWGNQANRNEPILHTHDRFGHRIDEVEYHPSWHKLLELSIGRGLHALPWEQPARPGAHAARAAMFYLVSQAESGHGCPLSMTSSVIPSLRLQPDVAEEWEHLVTARSYDPRFAPASEKRGVLMGMALTEKQGGSDVRANTSRAVPLDGGGPGAEYHLTGHKWFCSAPMCDAFLVLARAPGGLSCFLLPRWTPDGGRNAFHIQRLKDKLGNRSNASSEVEFDGAWARMVGEEGRGVVTIIEMINGTRLDCVIGSASIMRQALVQAIHHTRHRSAFGTLLAGQPLMQNVLADLAVEVEAVTHLMMRLAGAFDRYEADSREAHFRRLATPVTKYWVTRRAVPVVHEALECLGGAGYVEESIMPRLYREAPLNSIWEGSGNVIALDALRAMRREPESIDALLDELRLAGGTDAGYDAGLARLESQLAAGGDDEPGARRLVEDMALLLAGSLLLRFGRDEVAAAFVAGRLAGDRSAAFGTLPPSVDTEGILAGTFPA